MESRTVFLSFYCRQGQWRPLWCCPDNGCCRSPISCSRSGDDLHLPIPGEHHGARLMEIQRFFLASANGCLLMVKMRRCECVRTLRQAGFLASPAGSTSSGLRAVQLSQRDNQSLPKTAVSASARMIKVLLNATAAESGGRWPYVLTSSSLLAG